MTIKIRSLISSCKADDAWHTRTASSLSDEHGPITKRIRWSLSPRMMASNSDHVGFFLARAAPHTRQGANFFNVNFRILALNTMIHLSIANGHQAKMIFYQVSACILSHYCLYHDSFEFLT